MPGSRSGRRVLPVLLSISRDSDGVNEASGERSLVLPMLRKVTVSSAVSPAAIGFLSSERDASTTGGAVLPDTAAATGNFSETLACASATLLK